MSRYGRIREKFRNQQRNIAISLRELADAIERGAPKNEIQSLEQRIQHQREALDMIEERMEQTFD